MILTCRFCSRIRRTERSVGWEDKVRSNNVAEHGGKSKTTMVAEVEGATTKAEAEYGDRNKSNDEDMCDGAFCYIPEEAEKTNSTVVGIKFAAT
ncbi:hypothetical protein L6452_19900 [Arctium lappa]|uniref:Uncharacterized protein n=1 Tax=Arctium lappa TaxID=4217 RepID=A0ACB9BBQ7_ARCLA|nr:hypothetical protein L6452_19900 [Arctium lappa]